jgi:hypothetical protein
MTAFKLATTGLIALGIILSGPLACPVGAQDKEPPLGNVGDEDDPGLVQIRKARAAERSRLSAVNATYDFSKKTHGGGRRIAAAVPKPVEEAPPPEVSAPESTAATAAPGAGGLSINEENELNANPQIKAALYQVRVMQARGLYLGTIPQLEAIIRRFLAYALLQSGEPEAAVKQLNTYIKAFKPTAFDEFLLGSAYNAVGDYDGAKAAFKDGLVIAPEADYIRGELIKVLLAIYDYDAALAVCKERILKTNDPRTRQYYRRMYDQVSVAKRNSDFYMPSTPGGEGTKAPAATPAPSVTPEGIHG